MAELNIIIENIGGIKREELTIPEGATFVQGPNASNKTSFLKGLLFGLGARSVPIRSGAEEGRVILQTESQRVERVARRTETGIEATGDAWVSDAEEVTLLERFAALIETNSLRSAVARDEDVESLLKEPMNIDALEAERSQKMERKRSLSADIESVDDIEGKLGDCQRELEEKRERLTTLERGLEELREQQDESDTDERTQSLRDERADLRSEKAEFTEQVDQLEAAIERLEGRREELDQQLDETRATLSEHDLDELKEERENLQSNLDEVAERLDVLQSVLTTNREMVNSDFTGALGRNSQLTGDEVACWTCGEMTTIDNIEETLEDVMELVQEDKRQKREHEPEIKDLTEQIEEVRQSQKRLQDLEEKQRRIEQQLENRRDSLEERREQRDAIHEQIEDLAEKIERQEAERRSSQSDLTDEIEETRVNIQTVGREIERLEERRESLRERREEIEWKRQRIEELTDEIASLTERIENLENDLRDVFNDTMDELLDALEFERIDRVWLDGDFELVIARTVDGTVQRDSINHLAESEREMIGLVLALAGYVTYDVGDVTPVLVLDSLGAFDATRTERLVEYFADEARYLVATVHPDDSVSNDAETLSFTPSIEG
jgi:chromosome segregation ATPase